MKINSIVTVLDPVVTTTTALADIHTIDALACQGEAEAIVRWRSTAQVLSEQLTQAAKSQGNPLDDYDISRDCIRTQARAKSSVMLKTPRSEICLH
ncbi:MAG TPA: hypothetical protein EYP93_00225 [Gammaproteobacteria bacterium]|nr:hypothetical protein [Gammaproteobacteria bacterium]